MNQVKPIRKFDDKGRIIHSRYIDGFEQWWEYDANGNAVNYRDSNGKEYWYWEGEKTQDPIQILLLQKRLRDKAAKIS